MSEVLRRATWAEVTALFPHPRDAIRNAEGWADRYDIEMTYIPGCRVTLEAWTHEEIAAAMDAMTAIEPRMSVDMVDGVNNATLPPRIEGLPLAVVKLRNWLGMIDGKHRANKWRHIPGKYAVLVVHA